MFNYWLLVICCLPVSFVHRVITQQQVYKLLCVCSYKFAAFIVHVSFFNNLKTFLWVFLLRLLCLISQLLQEKRTVCHQLEALLSCSVEVQCMEPMCLWSQVCQFYSLALVERILLCNRLPDGCVSTSIVREVNLESSSEQTARKGGCKKCIGDFYGETACKMA
jgi:hypothetical protein